MLAIQTKNIYKTFGNTIACQGIDLAVEKGQIHALIGENGAGKSTLMKILYGLIQPDEGQIRINEQPVRIKNSQAAISLGLGMVHQHFKLIPRLSVLENIILGQEPKGCCLKPQEAQQKLKPLTDTLGFELKLDELVENLSLGERQRLEIVKALYRQAQILILDEPTAVLGPTEIAELFNLLHNLRKQGRTVIFISHKLEEVMSLADSITVMRRGQLVKTLKKEETDVRQLAIMMLGQEITLPVNKHLTAPGKPVLEIKNLCSKQQHGHQTIRQLSFNIQSGEILGIAGVAGNGQTELVELLTGLRHIESGQLHLNGNELKDFTPRHLRRSGIAHIPEDRQQRGIVSNFSVLENLLLGQQNNWENFGCLCSNTMRSEFSGLIGQFNVQPPDIDACIKYFSGGNQQKVVLARELSQAHNLLIACQPMRGLDLAASSFVYQKLLEEKAAGKAVLLVSTELEEIMSLSDRIAILLRGEIIAICDPKTVSREELGVLMGGGKGLVDSLRLIHPTTLNQHL